MENIENNENNKRKEIEIVSGNPKDLNISPVYDHIEIEKPVKEKKKNIIIPENKEKKNK